MATIFAKINEYICLKSQYKYIRIDKIEPEQLRKFELKFEYDNVKSFKIEMTDTKPEEQDFIELIKSNAKDLYNLKFN